MSDQKDNIEHVDFGAERRRLERMMGRLLGIADDMRAELERDPVRYYARAVDEIVALQQHVHDIEEALRGEPIDVRPIDPSAPPPPLSRPLQIMEKDYERFRRAEEVIRRGPVRTPREQDQ